MLDRDLRLVALTRARYHAAIVAAPVSLSALRRAKAEGLPISCGTSINHLTLNEGDIGDYRSFLKLRPPLRGEEDRKLLVKALAEGLIDVIVSDHDPQDVETKRLPFAQAEFGAIGLETMLAAGLRLVHSGDVALPACSRRCRPARPRFWGWNRPAEKGRAGRRDPLRSGRALRGRSSQAALALPQHAVRWRAVAGRGEADRGGWGGGLGG